MFLRRHQPLEVFVLRNVLIDLLAAWRLKCADWFPAASAGGLSPTQVSKMKDDSLILPECFFLDDIDFLDLVKNHLVSKLFFTLIAVKL